MPTSPTPERAAARAAGLRYVDDTQPGFTRLRAGKGFRYRDADGHAVRDAATLQRIRALAIPPAYTAVWICAYANGHLQATGRDARGRKQYRYHADWAKVRDAGKFDRIIAFGEALPTLRRRLARDLRQSGFPRTKVLAVVVALLADTLVRIGNETYARENRSFGLTTLRNRHLELLRGGRVRMRFRGKSGQLQEVTVGDRRLGQMVRRLQQLPGQSLFQYRDDDGQVQPVDSGAVNEYLRDVMGEDFTAKDFRTWGGTVAAVQALAATALPEPASQRALAAAQREVVCQVAARLGNTPAVCRRAYIDPCVFAGWERGELTALAGLRGPRQWEQATLRVLRRARRLSRSRSR
ncbi:TPA: DNA topoisomerase IB [Stenotrophomonas maltophilia]|uniref:DNA topoisomerase IB n=1 Tax=Stenotrophomonas TaxID=40323 RepID=UPI0013D99B99|nr:MULTISPECIES: DNA topoisomerase IB [Stenotrophomonas]MDH2022095.1 DNA topoisomerase IB [Stenotrophomonas sp. GD03680]HEL3749900.1 DNA topoisomerase IB [Stenotrophomonas maltophilia]HEL7728419.1 DNA topoisomerase IB [Stenotrophomonas maltophilia]